MPTEPLWIGCSECDVLFDCYDGKTRCIRLPEAVSESRLRQALRIIAGEQLCLDNLMSDKDIARAALEGTNRG